MQRLNIGRLEGIQVRGGEPILKPMPRIVREIKIGGDNGPRPEARREDFLLKGHVTELFRHLDELRDGTVELLEVKHGLPFRLLITQVPA
jgi:hypothetical protein